MLYFNTTTNERVIIINPIFGQLVRVRNKKGEIYNAYGYDLLPIR